MYQSTRLYVPDIHELEYYLDPDEDHGLDREGIKLLFSYAMDVWPTDNEVSSTVCTEYWNLGSFGSSLGCELSYCKGNDVVFVLFEKYFDKGNEGINIFIRCALIRHTFLLSLHSSIIVLTSKSNNYGRD